MFCKLQEDEGIPLLCGSVNHSINALLRFHVSHVRGTCFLTAVTDHCIFLQLQKMAGELQAEREQKLSLQKQLSNKIATVASHTITIKTLERQKNEAEDTSTSLKQSCRERQTKISSLQESVWEVLLLFVQLYIKA